MRWCISFHYPSSIEDSRNLIRLLIFKIILLVVLLNENKGGLVIWYYPKHHTMLSESTNEETIRNYLSFFFLIIVIIIIFCINPSKSYLFYCYCNPFLFLFLHHLDCPSTERGAVIIPQQS